MATQGSDFTSPEVMYPPVAEKGSSSGALVAAPYAAPVPAMGGYAPRGPEIIHGGFNQTWLAHCLRRRWLMALLMGLLLSALTAGVLLWLFPETFRTTAYLRVKAKTGSEFLEDNTQKLSPQEIERQAMNHLALLRAPMVLDAALQQQEVADLDAVKAHKGEELLWLLDELKVSFPGDGEILEVRYEGSENPEQMVKVVDAVVKAYQDKVLFQDRLTSVGTQDDLRNVLSGIQGRLQKQLETLKEKQAVSGQLQEEVEIPLVSKEIGTLESLILEVTKELEDLEVMKRLAVLNGRSPAAVEAWVAEQLEKDPIFSNYRQTLFGLQQAYQQQLATARNKNSAQLRKLTTQMQQTEQAMAQYKMSAEKSARDQAAKMPNEALRATMVEYYARVESASKRLKEHQDKLAKARQRLLELGVSNPEVDMLQKNIESEQEIAYDLDQKVKGWQIEAEARDAKARQNQQSDFEKVSIMQPATAVPNGNIERWSIASVGALAAFALTCYGIALLEFRHRRLNGPTDIDEGLGVRVLGVLPPTTLKTLAGNNLVATQVAEAIDSVRATLMHDSTSGPRQVIMVTSPATMEGTTTVASSLALSLSRAGRRTLLVDGDVRSPSLHKLFGMPIEDGLCEVLRSEIDLADAIRPTNNEGLYLLTAGVCNAEAIHALATDQPQAVFEKLRDQFDFIVIDAPPVLGISDSLSLGQYIDGAILTVLRDHSEVRKVHKAVETIKSMGIRLIGAVVNGVPLKPDRRVVRLHQSLAQSTPRLPAKSES